MPVKSKLPPAPPPAAILWDVVEAACRLRDADWDEDCSRPLDALERAVDAYRAELRRRAGEGDVR